MLNQSDFELIISRRLGLTGIVTRLEKVDRGLEIRNFFLCPFHCYCIVLGLFSLDIAEEMEPASANLCSMKSHRSGIV